MASLQNTFALSLFLMTLCGFFVGNLGQDRKDYIVYMGKLSDLSGYSPLDHHHNILQEVLEEGMQSEQSLIRSYGRSLNGFAAKLTEKERVKIARMEGIVSVFPSVTLELQTTRSWDFMEFGEHVNRVPTVESNTIIGVIDTGVWPELESFSDKSFGNFRGRHNERRSWSWNPYNIHGSRKSSESCELIQRFGRSNARGAVPRSRVAIYKACWLIGGCKSDALLAAFDDAISDGIDIISVSIAFKYAYDYTQDVIAIGAFHAMQHGILTSQAAGNNGPSLSSTTSIAPWIISVAASTIDRQFVDKVVLGDNTTLTGSAIINGFDLKGKMFPLIAGYQAVNLNSCSIEDGRKCVLGCLLADKIEGKIVLCENATIISAIEPLGAVGVIIAQQTPFFDHAINFPFPTSLVNLSQGERIISYLNTTKNPQATILKSEAPDITAPGVEIFAAWSPKALLSTIRGETRYAKYNIISGTSMACPHVSGAAAYVKTFHPHWSPSAIKSALMTTASHMNATRNSDREFAYGAGHLNPVKAIDPGLVYEAFEDDYVMMLCSIGLDPEKIKLITGNTSTNTCSPNYKGTTKDLNYPSMAVFIYGNDKKENTFSRTVTNVGLANSTYKATVTSPSELRIIVEPNVLSFKSLNEKQSFVVRVSVKTSPQQEVVSASLVWSDGVHNVRSPMVVHYKS
ncbi:hypothetical protein Syun_021565 [Stephania yunnanensis]|uniref:Uncharacterized protein n=1 Tax=Stephania yunnanensis TaxID=152371 RepID=A0AAP0IGU7_9MAGN